MEGMTNPPRARRVDASGRALRELEKKSPENVRFPACRRNGM
jgi:hypothetical protein